MDTQLPADDFAAFSGYVQNWLCKWGQTAVVFEIAASDILIQQINPTLICSLTRVASR